MKEHVLIMKKHELMNLFILLEKIRKNEPARIEYEFNNAQKLKRMELDSQENQKDAELRTLRENKARELENQEKLKEAELKLLSEKQAEKTEERESVVNRAKRYGDTIRTSLFHMGQETLEIISFLDMLKGSLVVMRFLII